MNEPTSNIDGEAAAASELVGLIQRINASVSQPPLDEAALRALCGLARPGGSEPEAFQSELADHGLDSTIAGNVKLLFLRPHILEAFLQPDPPLAWGDAVNRVWQELVQELSLLMAGLDTDEGRCNEGKFRTLCRWAGDSGVDPETYRRLLVSAGLAASRASEIKSVLECAAACQDFIRTGNSVTWAVTLKRSRENPADQFLRTARRLVRQVLQLLAGLKKPLPKDGLTCGSLRIRRESQGRIILEHATEGALTFEPRKLFDAPACPPQPTP